jgi:ParB family chromosome partitioning protein
MASKKASLGRGLGALLGQSALRPVPSTSSATAAEPAARVPGSDELLKLPVDLLQRGKYQPRLDMRQESLQELADSIKSQGIVQPIVVRPIGDSSDAPRRYEIIAGERRWRAAQMAGLHEIPAIVREVPDEAAVAMALIENIQREDLNPLEEARALERLIAEFQMTHQSAAEAVGRSRAAVSNLLRLLELAEEVKGMVERREIEMGHARALLAVTNRRQQVQVATLVADKHLSVRETEALVKRTMAQTSEEAPVEHEQSNPNIRKLETDLTEKLGAKVHVQHSPGGKGKLVISYNSLDELDGILEHIVKPSH